MSKSDKKVFPYVDSTKTKTVLRNYRTYEYHLPFNYENIKVVRAYNCGEPHGMELNAINSHYPDTERKPADYIEIGEQEAIVDVEVIGSACTPPGFIMLSATPLEGFRRPDEPVDITPVRFRVGNLWGMHLRADQWLVHGVQVPRFVDTYPPYQALPEEFRRLEPDLKDCYMKTDYHEFPLCGMSSARFSIPLSSSVRITAGSETMGWTDDVYPDDNHYSIRIIRVTVCDVEKGE